MVRLQSVFVLPGAFSRVEISRRGGGLSVWAWLILLGINGLEGKES